MSEIREHTEWCTLDPSHDGPCAWSYPITEETR